MNAISPTRMKCLKVFCFLSASLVIVGSAYPAAFVPLSSLDISFPGLEVENTIGVTDDGLSFFGSAVRIVGNSVVEKQAFIWTAETGARLLGSARGQGGFPFSQVSGISADGSTIVGTVRGDHGDWTVARWNDATGWVPVDLGIDYSFALNPAVSPDGSEMIGALQLEPYQPYRWSEGTGAVLIGNEPRTPTLPTGVTPDLDVVIGNYLRDSVPEPWRWTQESGMVPLGVGGVDYAKVSAISADGRFIVGSGHDGDENTAFYWTQEAGFVEIARYDNGGGSSLDPGGHVSGDGSVIVADYFWDASNGIRSLRNGLTKDAGISEAELAGWSGLRANGITSDGRVLHGNGRNPLGQFDTWVAYLDETVHPSPPEGNFVAGIPVRSVTLSPADELVSFVAGGTTFTRNDLIQPTLVAFAEEPSAPQGGTILVKEGAPVPDPGSRSALLTDDFRLDTGIGHPAIDAEAATLAFSEPLVNGPGPDLVIFDVDFHFQRYAEGNAYQLRVGQHTSVVLESSWGKEVDEFTGVRGSTKSQVTSIDQLENESFSLGAPQLHSTSVYGTTIDLSDLGIAPFEQITTLNFGSYGLHVDPVLFMGIDSTRLATAGDFSGNGTLDAADIDLLTSQVPTGEYLIVFDLNADAVVDAADRDFWVRDLKHTFFGDANLDGEFSTTDLVAVFTAGEYEDSIDGSSGWATGDWNGDGDFSTADLVLAFQEGGYEQGPRTAANPVPEPGNLVLLTAGLLCTVMVIRNRLVIGQ